MIVSVFALAARHSLRPALIWLTVASFAFYGYWAIGWLPLLTASIALNHVFGLIIGRLREGHAARCTLIAAVACNLMVLGYFKYTAFALDVVNDLFGTAYAGPNIALPVGISFFTFTQIAYLVDLYRRLTIDYDPVRYALFVSFFPHLIAGPILHHKPMMEQFSNSESVGLRSIEAVVGLTFFAIGLGKKMLLADPLAAYASPIFESARTAPVSFLEGWIASLAYTFQIYFDFSGYSDMAVGLALLFGIRIPINFFSPYKATSIIEFWRRWHISLSDFLRDYLYVPLGGNRKGEPRRYLNIYVTMLLGGLWHGASWNFVIWGALHGSYILVNHAWRDVMARFGKRGRASLVLRLMGGFATFLAVVVAWVWFRAHDVPTALRLLAGMADYRSGLNMPDVNLWHLVPLLTIAASVAFFVPNSVQITEAIREARKQPDEMLSLLWAAAFGLVSGVSILLLGSATEFLYFRF